MNILLFLVITLFVGCLIHMLIYRKIISFPHLLGSSFLLGSGVLTYLTFVFGLLDRQYKLGDLFFFLIIPTILCLGIAVACVRRMQCFLDVARSLRESNHRVYAFLSSWKEKPLLFVFESVLLLFLFCFITLIFLEGYVRPDYTWDSIGFWTMKAKLFFYEGRLAIDDVLYTAQPDLSKPYYPLHVPLVALWIALLSNAWVEGPIRAMMALYLLALIGILYSEFRRVGSRIPAILGCIFLLTIPFISFHGTIPYADLTLSIYLTCSLIFSYRWMQTYEVRDLLYWGIFGGLASWTKYEGLFFWLIQWGVVLLYMILNKRTVRVFFEFFIASFLFLVLSLPWKLIGIFYGFREHRVDSLFPNLGRLKDIFLIWLPRTFFIEGTWGLFWGLFIIAIILRWNLIKTTKLKYLFMTVFGAFLFIIYTWLVVADWVYGIISTGINRNILLIVPMGVFSLYLLLSDLFLVRINTSQFFTGSRNSWTDKRKKPRNKRKVRK